MYDQPAQPGCISRIVGCGCSLVIFALVMSISLLTTLGTVVMEGASSPPAVEQPAPAPSPRKRRPRGGR